MPSGQSVHVDRLITQIMVGYSQDLEEFKADYFYPPLPADKEHDLFGKYDKSTFFRRPTTAASGILRAFGAPYPKAEYKVLTDNFRCEEYGLEHMLDDRIKKLADPAFAVTQVPVTMLTYHVLRERENRVQTKVRDVTQMLQNVTLAGSSQWSDTGSNPINDIETGCQTILSATGKLPNLASFPWQVWRYLKHHPMLIDRLKYKENQPVTVDIKGFKDIFAESFTPDAQVIVPKVIFDNSGEGLTFSGSYLWGKDVQLAYVDPAPVRERPTFGYTFVNEPLQALLYRKEEILSDVYRVRHVVGEKTIDNNFLYLIKAAVP